jgi:radical SAM protein
MQEKEPRDVANTPRRDRFDRAPLIAIWEVTRACDLACVHCRAEAIPERETGELTTDEGKSLIRTIREFGKPFLVLTGGDPLKRPDIYELINEGVACGLVTSLSPSGTPLLDFSALRRASEHGLSAVSISIDGECAEVHDRFRGVEGSFQHSIEGAAATVALGLQLQINTTIAIHNLDRLPAIGELVEGLGAVRWSVFFVVPTGRADVDQLPSAGEFEQVLRWLHEYSKSAPFRIKTTEAPHYRRVALQALAAASGDDPLELQRRSRSGGGRFVPGINDGRGFVFISSLGEIFPSGFLPLSAGNVRRQSIVDVYRDHEMFVALRNPDRLEGRCGACEFRSICGGSRARAYALTGNLLAEDPACAYLPPDFVAADNEHRLATH